MYPVPLTTNAKGKSIADSKNKNQWVTQIIEITSPSVTVTGLKANTGYQFQVRAVNESGKSDWSAISTVAAAKTTSAIATAEAPDLKKAKFAKPKAVPDTTTADSATITWATVANATSYVLTYTIPSGVKGVPGTTITKVLTGEELANATNDKVTYKIEGLKSSTTYKVSIFAQNASGTTTKTVSVKVKTLKIAAPTKLASSKTVKPTVSTINLTWQPPKKGFGVDGVNGYIVEVWAPPASKGVEPELVQVVWVDKDTTSLEIKDLEKKTKYTVRLTYTTGSGLDGLVLDRGIESAVANKVITTAK